MASLEVLSADLSSVTMTVDLDENTTTLLGRDDLGCSASKRVSRKQIEISLDGAGGAKATRLGANA